MTQFRHVLKLEIWEGHGVQPSTPVHPVLGNVLRYLYFIFSLFLPLRFGEFWEYWGVENRLGWHMKDLENSSRFYMFWRNVYHSQYSFEMIVVTEGAYTPSVTSVVEIEYKALIP